MADGSKRSKEKKVKKKQVASEISLLTLENNLHVFIQPLVDLISKSPSSGWEIHFACPQPTRRRAVPCFLSVGFSSSQLLDSSSTLIL